MIVGGGPVLDSLKEQAEKLNIADKVVFTGLIPWEDIPYYYHISNVFVNASKSETQGLTYVEALAAGVPNLVLNDLCIEDVIREGYNGFIFNDMDEFVSKMEYCLTNNLDDIIKNTKPSSLEFSKEKFAENIYNVYLEAIEINNNKKKKKK